MTLIKGTFSQDLEVAIDSAIHNEIVRYTCQLFEKGGKYGYKPLGSGVCLKISDKYFIVTASHVVENQSEFYVKGNGKFVAIVGDSRSTDIAKSNGIDLAYIILDKSILDDFLFNHDFLPINKIQGRHKLLDASQYVICGYPERNIKVVNNNVSTGSSYFILPPQKEHVYNYYKLKKEHFFLFEYKGKAVNVITNTKSKNIKDPYGISGGGIWCIVPTQTDNGFDIQYRLIGIVIGGKTKYMSLVGVRIELLIEDMHCLGEINILIKHKN